MSDGKRAREQWYLAEIVEEIRVETDPRNVVHINLVLVRAHSKSDAWAKAIELGRGGEASYTNPAGKRVTVTFRGLRQLDVIGNRLEHGTELTYEQHIDVASEDVSQMVVEKNKLNLFNRRPSEPVVDYSDAGIVSELRMLLRGRSK